jgi:hypothetical protein
MRRCAVESAHDWRAAAVKGYNPRQALIAQMPKVGVTRIARLVARVTKIALSDHSKRADGRQ